MRLRLLKRHQAAIVLACAALLTGQSCRTTPGLPTKSSKEYDEAVRAFYVSLAALQVGDDIRADAKLAQLTQLVPNEPAGWGNWGVLALRQRNFDSAAERLERARTLVPENDQVQYLVGLMESSRGRSNEAIAALQQAVVLNPKNLVSLYKLAEEKERLGDEKSLAEVQQLVQKLLDAEPQNLAALIEMARLSAKRGDTQTLRNAVNRIAERSSSWPDDVKQQLTAVQTAANGSDPASSAVRVTFLRNVLVRVPEYRQNLASIKPAPGEEAQPFTALLKMESPSFSPAVADTGLTFTAEHITDASSDKWSWIGAVSLNGDGAPTLVFASEREISIGKSTFSFPSGSAATPPRTEGIASIDFNYDFKTDLVLAGAGGLRLLKQESSDKFTDVTSETKLSPTILNGNYTAAWSADVDADGDLDIILGSDQSGPNVLRNNGDGTFTDSQLFSVGTGISGFVWADIDGDGDPDASLIDNQKRLHVFTNERSGQFKERQLPADVATVKAVTAADLDQNSILDLVVVQTDGAIIQIADKDEGASWTTKRLTSFSDFSQYLDKPAYLRAVDLDNNGANDLLLTFGSEGSPMIWLGDANNVFTQLKNPGNEFIFTVADVNSDGRLDLIGLSADGKPVQDINHGTKNYHWQVIRPRAANAVGDQRINSFGIGGEMEIRAGNLLQKQLITSPTIHFGLGDQTGADVVRIVWPNGAVRAEFETKADQTILAEQRLKGSCPFLFAFDGKEMKFVKDSVPWSSAIGLRINTLGTARVEATEEWYKIRGDQLAPHDGYYDLRITAELWETYYYDQLGLMVVDHPVGTDVFVDERFVIPPAKLAITTVSTPHKIARAIDDNGTDVTGVVNSLDEKYLDTFGRGRYQGVTRDHYVELDLGDDLPTSGPVYLIAHGWMHPTDSSVNVAISQGNNVKPKPLSLELPDGKGGWTTAIPNLGFPAGRKKICLFDLTGLFKPGMPHRLRLRTTLEVYWDLIEWAQGVPDAQLKTLRMSPQVADLHFRGFSVINKADESSPEVPDYNKLASSKQIWRDLIGNYTRFGDVRELLEKADDRYVIMNAGDEMSFRFAEQPSPPAGWVRDFLIIGDGWIKDGDYNSTFSKTVLPLPYHAKQEYTTPPTVLEDEWVYKQHPTDWQTFHTRYVTPESFINSLRPRTR